MTTGRQRVLMIAFHFPPMTGSSGIQRTLRFVQHLPAQGWDPIVLTAHPRVYDKTSEDLLRDVPAEVPVHRAFALDAAKHLAVAGRFPRALARPDRWSSWWWGAVPAGLSLIRRWRPSVLWSTYPIASAHRVALTLQRLSGLPLVMDFRDPMAQDGYPADPRTWQAFSRIEQDAARRAARLVFVSPGCLRTYQQRFASTDGARFALIENGFDEEAFVDAEQGLDPTPLIPGRLTLLHSGVVYPSERDPRALFEALGRLRAAGQIDDLRLRFRAPGHAGLLRELAAKTGTADVIEIAEPIAYKEALREMLRADGLLVMQGANCNDQVPAKLYEYFRAGRPIIGLTDPAGDTGQTLRGMGVESVAMLEDADAVHAGLAGYLARLRQDRTTSWPAAAVSAMSRQARARQLAALMDSVVAAR
jgi:glycosyltransferase involved in cell wall biosynthesis